MVNVNKTVSKSGAQKQPATTQRRPRNTELNSSKKELTPIQKRIQNARKANLNSSRRFGEFEYRPVSAQELAERDGITLDELQSFIDDWEGQGYNVSGFLLCDDYAAVSGGNDVLVETDNGVYLWDEGGDLVDVDELDSSCGSKLDSTTDNTTSAEDSINQYLKVLVNHMGDGDSTYGIDTKAYLGDMHTPHENDEVGMHVEGRDADLVAAASANAVNDDWNTFIEYPGVAQVVVTCWSTVVPDRRMKMADVPEYVKAAVQKLNGDENINSTKKLNSAEGESGEPAGDAVITTESGNEVALSDIKIVQNPDTNELALFVKETEDDEIPEGFVVIADAAQAALPSNNTCPECGQAPCVCEGAGETGGEEEGEELDSSKKKVN